MNRNPFKDIIKQKGENDIVILDGGLATEIERLGKNLNSHLWSAK